MGGKTMNCIYCGQPVPQPRAEAGIKYCMDKSCVVTALQERQANLRLILMPKQGFTYVFKDSDDLKHGKSSGR
jgi:hypothetical protein